jgi:hypothetical protein
MAAQHLRNRGDRAGNSIGKDAIESILWSAVRMQIDAGGDPFAFAIIEGADRLAEYSGRAKSHLPVEQMPAASRAMLGADSYNIFHGAAALVVLCARGADFSAVDCCLAAHGVMDAAHGAGLATRAIGFALPWLSLPETKRELGIPQSYVPVFPIALGRELV